MIEVDDLTLQALELPKVWQWRAGPFRLCFIFLRKGSGLYSGPQSRQPFAARGLLVLNTGAKGLMRTLSSEKLSGDFFHARIEHLVTVFPMNEFCLLERSLRSLSGPLWYPAGSVAFQKSAALLRITPRGIDMEHRCHVLKIMAAVLQEFRMTQVPLMDRGHPGSANHGILSKLTLEQIQNSSIQHLAHRFGCTSRHLNRLFHQKFGISGAALKMEMRLLKAVALLKNPDSKISQVAFECGFNYLNLFSARFKKRFGASPRRWREQGVASIRLGARVRGRPDEQRMKSTTHEATRESKRREAEKHEAG